MIKFYELYELIVFEKSSQKKQFFQKKYPPCVYNKCER